MQSIYLRLNVVAAGLFLLAACTGTKNISSNYQQRYQTALLQAINPGPADIHTGLTPVNATNDDLIRDSIGRIKVVVWTDWEGYGQRLNDTIRLSRNVWVTIAPEVKDACKKLKRSVDKSIRIGQWLGLKPDPTYTHFVEMYVYTSDLFRPCPDPEITDRECELTFPEGLYVQTDTTYKSEYRNIKEGTSGYPFTGLGYTYDWGSTTSRVGFSEYIVKANAVVYISTYLPTDTYCQ